MNVLDISRGVAGDFCARLFADNGARVTKVEPPGGSPLRREGPFFAGEPHPEQSLLFWHLNTGKRSLVLNLETSRGQELLHGLAAGADLVISSGDIDTEALARTNPAILVCSTSGFGQTGPRAGWAGSELIYQALGGSMYATGDMDREPLYGYGRRAEYLAGTYLYIAGAACMGRADGPSARRVEVSAVESVAASLMNFTTMYAYNGHVYTRRGSGNPLALLQCRDGWVVLYLHSRWEELCEILGADDLRADSRWADPKTRLAQWPTLRELLRPYFMNRGSQELVTTAQDRHITLTRVMTPQDLLASEHLCARGFFESVETPCGPMIFVGPAFRMSGTPRRPLQAPPRTGEHTTEVLAELGLSAADVNGLVGAGVVA
jgi:crotonobetainyl-CoA:carnitine CoA-transferase CaiB-like acyl-CoA transferase